MADINNPAFIRIDPNTAWSAVYNTTIKKVCHTRARTWKFLIGLGLAFAFLVTRAHFANFAETQMTFGMFGGGVAITMITAIYSFHQLADIRARLFTLYQAMPDVIPSSEDHDSILRYDLGDCIFLCAGIVLPVVLLVTLHAAWF